MSTPAPRLSLTPADLDLERRKHTALSLILDARRGLEAMRVCLEPASADGALEALTRRGPVLEAIVALAAMLRAKYDSASDCITKCHHTSFLGRITGLRPRPATLRAPGLAAWTDQDSLQRFRRAALSDLERLERELASRQECDWRSNADVNRQRAVRRVSLRWGASLALAAMLLAVWWGWQRARQEASQILMNRAKTEVAAQAVKLISLAGWLAQKTQGKPLSAMAQDMSASCAGINLRETPPDSPCREAWAANRQALFRGVIPEPGKPVDAPSEIFFDPWGAPYVLLIPESGPPRPAQVVSAGPDGFLGTPDDVSTDIPAWNQTK